MEPNFINNDTRPYQNRSSTDIWFPSIAGEGSNYGDVQIDATGSVNLTIYIGPCFIALNQCETCDPNLSSSNGTQRSDQRLCQVVAGRGPCCKFFSGLDALVGHLFLAHNVRTDPGMDRAAGIRSSIHQVKPFQGMLETTNHQVTRYFKPEHNLLDHLSFKNDSVGSGFTNDEQAAAARNSKKVECEHPDSFDFPSRRLGTKYNSQATGASSTLRIDSKSGARKVKCKQRCIACCTDHKRCFWDARCGECVRCVAKSQPCCSSDAEKPLMNVLDRLTTMLDDLPVSNESRHFFVDVDMDGLQENPAPFTWRHHGEFMDALPSVRTPMTTVLGYQIRAAQEQLPTYAISLAHYQLSSEHQSDPVHSSMADDNDHLNIGIEQRHPGQSLKGSSPCIQSTNDAVGAYCGGHVRAPDTSTSTSLVVTRASPSASTSEPSTTSSLNTPLSIEYSSPDSETSLVSDSTFGDVTAKETKAARLLARICLSLTFKLVSIRHGRFARGDVRSMPCQDGDSQETVPSCSSSSTKRKETFTTSAKGKQRENRRSNEDEDEQDSQQSPSKRNKPTEAIDSLSFACPYNKFDPLYYSLNMTTPREYHGCGGCFLKDISAVKQHLSRRHAKPDFYCATCYCIFESSDQRDEHARTRSCESSPYPFGKKMRDEMLTMVKKKRKRDEAPIDAWYLIFGTLFPGAQPPPSPYIDGPMSREPNVALHMFRSLGPFAQLVYNVIRKSSCPLPVLTQTIVEQAFQTYVQEPAVRSHSHPIGSESFPLPSMVPPTDSATGLHYRPTYIDEQSSVRADTGLENIENSHYPGPLDGSQGYLGDNFLISESEQRELLPDLATLDSHDWLKWLQEYDDAPTSYTLLVSSVNGQGSLSTDSVTPPDT